ncbi:MAG: 2TM domain-containing protein [Candidatus Nanopelagicales bacterium]
MTSGPEYTTSEQELRAQAAQNLKRRTDFYWHVVAFVIINGMFWILWALLSGTDSYPWPIWITLFWGIGLAFHAGDALRRPVSQAAIDREVERMRGRPA